MAIFCSQLLYVSNDLHGVYVWSSLVQTEECIDTFDFEMARLFCQRALDIESNNLHALDMLGHIYSELGNTQKAKEISFALVHILFFPFHFNTAIFHSGYIIEIHSWVHPPWHSISSFSSCCWVESRCWPQQVYVPWTDSHRPGGCELLH